MSLYSLLPIPSLPFQGHPDHSPLDLHPHCLLAAYQGHASLTSYFLCPSDLCGHSWQASGRGLDPL